MTLAEFVGCSMVAFGPALAMFSFTITDDPIKIILLIFSAFVWLLALLVSSFLWFILIPLRDVLIIGVLFSIIIQVIKILHDSLLDLKFDFSDRKYSGLESTNCWRKRALD
jgi:hypothetical protein